MSAGSASAAISPAAGFGFHCVPFNVVRLEIPWFQLRASPHVPRFVHSTWRHDQHLITANSDPDECTALPLWIHFCLSYTSRSNWHDVHSLSKFTQLSALQLTSMQFERCAPVTTNLIPRQQPSCVNKAHQDRMCEWDFTPHSLLPTQSSSLGVCFCISRTVTSWVPFD